MPFDDMLELRRYPGSLSSGFSWVQRFNVYKMVNKRIIKVLKKIAISLVVLILLPCLIYGGLLVNNNRDVGAIELSTIVDSQERSIQWILANRESILNKQNPMLWWFVMRSVEINQDHRLRELLKEYRKRYVDDRPTSVWRQLFNPYARNRLNPDMIQALPYYNQYLIYGYSCDQKLASLPLVQKQMQTSFCREYHPISPACVTHQMMALRFRQQRKCGDSSEVDFQVTQLQEMIEAQINWDPRVVDVYLQRVVMLLESGAEERVRPSWIRNVLDEQQEDGGWSASQSLLKISDDMHIVFYSRGVRLTKPRSDFHVTAQGLLMMSLLTAQMAKQ